MLEVLALALVSTLVHDVIDDHPAGEVGAGDAGQRALVAALQLVEVQRQLRRVAVDDRGQHGQRVGLPADVVGVAHRSCWIVVSNDSYAALNAAGSSSAAWRWNSVSAASTCCAEMISVVVKPGYADQ